MNDKSGGLLGDFLSRLTSHAIRRPVIVIASIAVLIAISAFILIKTPPAGDVTRLLPSNAEKTGLYFKAMRDFGAMEKLYIVFSSDSQGIDLKKINSVGTELETSGLFKHISWKIDDRTKTFLKDSLMAKMPLYLDESGMREFLGKLTPSGIEAALKKTKDRLSLPAGRMSAYDPLDLFSLYGSKMKIAEVSVDPASGYFLTPDKQKLIMIAEPVASPRDIKTSGKMLAEVREILSKHPALKAEITGSHAITHHEASIMKSEIIMNFATSLIAVLCLYFLKLKGTRGLWAAIVPAIVSIPLTASAVSLMTGSITEVSGGFAGLILGLGDDLGLVLYIRYSMYVSKGMPSNDAVDRGVRSAGAGITVGVITTSLTFLPMTLSSFRGIRELGLLTGIGIAMTWLLLFWMFPLLVGKARPPKVQFKILERLFQWSYDNPKKIMFAALLITVVFAWFIPAVRLETDYARLGAKQNPARDVLLALERDYMPKRNIVITASAPTPEEASEKAYEIENLFKTDAASVADIVPPESMQQKNIEALSAIDADGVIAEFRKKAASMGFRRDAFDEYLIGLKKALNNRQSVKLDDMAPMSSITERLIRKQDNGYQYIVTLSDNNGDMQKAVESAAKAGALPPGAEFTGPGFVKQELIHILKRDAAIVTIIGLLLVNIALFIDFRSPWMMLICQIPVLMASAIVAGLMGMAGIGLNFMNVFVFVMLFGIGTDYTIHLIHSRRQGRGMSELANETGSAVLLAGLTTVAGFGSMAFSAYRGLSSLGIVTTTGVLCCVILSIVMAPAAFRLGELKGPMAPDNGGKQK